jgi:cerevisin
VQGDDKDGHGTHVAGTSAGQFFGVAKGANLFAVKVLDDQGAGPISDIISGLNVVSQRVASLSGNSTTGGTNTTTTIAPAPVQVIDIPQPGGQLRKRVTANANNFTLLNQLPNSLNNGTNSVTAPIGNNNNITSPIGNNNNITFPIGGGSNTTTAVPIGSGGNTTTAVPPIGATGTHPSVVNLSLGGTSHSNALDAAVKALVDQGVVMVIAAGNDGVDVGDASPADVAEAITVGAMDVHDAVPSFSDFG